MADDSSGTTLIDEKGRIFGYVNIIDLLVVLLLAAVVVAGVTLILTAEDEEAEEEQYVTLELDAQPEYIAEQIQIGDRSHEVDSTLTITDTYMTASETDREVNIWVQAKINGTTTGDVDALTYGESPIRLGESLTIDTDQYNETGTVTDISETQSELATESKDLAVVADVDQTTADRMSVEDEFTIGDNTWMTIEEMTRYATADRGTDRLVLGISTEVRSEDNMSRYGDQTVQLGESIPVRVGSDQVTGSIMNIDSLEEPGEQRTRTVTMQADTAKQPSADRVEPEMVEVIGDNEFAEIQDVQSTDGAVEITVEMTVQEHEDGTVAYRTEEIGAGDNIGLRLDNGPNLTWHVTEVNS